MNTLLFLLLSLVSPPSGIPWEELSRPGKAVWRRRANAALQSQREEDVAEAGGAVAEEIGFRISWGIRK